jgi:hypothetical protein
MSDRGMVLDIPIKYKNNNNDFYKNNNYGFPDFNNITRYIFILTINGEKINNLIFKNMEKIKYSHLIKLDDKIKLNDIKTYKIQVSIIANNIISDFELEGDIMHNQSNSTQNNRNLYIEFTQNENGYALCTCFYTGLDYNKLFVSPPN